MKILCILQDALVILASEDIGLANPNARILSNSILNSVKEIGMPSARILLSQQSYLFSLIT